MRILKVALFCYCVAPSFVCATNLIESDGELIAHIKRTDYLRTTALGVCSNETIKRTNLNSKNYFEYTAICEATAAKESDCPEDKISDSQKLEAKTMNFDFSFHV